MACERVVGRACRRLVSPLTPGTAAAASRRCEDADTNCYKYVVSYVLGSHSRFVCRLLCEFTVTEGSCVCFSNV